jgi:hypothetical protein
VDRGHVLLQKGDKMITHEGNIYDFGGYWQYNLGNSYVEHHIKQDATINDRRPLAHIKNDPYKGNFMPDLLDPPGPDWTKICATTDPDKQGEEEITRKGGDWENIWVTKTYGNSYDYREGDSIEVREGNQRSIRIGGATNIDESYSSSGNKTYYSKSSGGVKEEWKWSYEDGKQMSYSKRDSSPHGFTSEEVNWVNKATSTINYAATASSTLNFAAVASFSLSIDAKAGLDISLSAVASVSISMAASAKLAIDLAAKINIALSASVFLDIKAGAGVGAEIEGKPMKFTYKKTNGRFRWNGPGTKVEKEADIKADMEKFALRKMMTLLSKGDTQLIKLSLAASKITAGVESANIKLFT